MANESTHHVIYKDINVAKICIWAPVLLKANSGDVNARRTIINDVNESLLKEESNFFIKVSEVIWGTNFKLEVIRKTTGRHVQELAT